MIGGVAEYLLHYSMNRPWVTGFITGFLLVQFVEISGQSYRAAVVAYKPERHYDDLPENIRARNLNNYRLKIEEVKDKADIIVFPEYGLTTIEVTLKPKQHLESYSVVVPDPSTNFHCNSSNNVDNVLREISCLAKRTLLYVIYNVVEKAEENNVMNFYSTDLVFDSDGKLILRCRKKRMSNELNFNTGDLSQKCTFRATFKKRNNHNFMFGILFDSDILFFTPEDPPRDLILTSSLKNELPLSYSLSIQAAFSVRNKVNLLVSEYNDLDKFYGGSGIYFKNGTSTVSVQPSYIVVEEIPKSGNDIAVTQVHVQAPGWEKRPINLPFQNISTLDRTDSEFSYSFNEKDSSCKFEMEGDDINPYKWVAFNDKLKYLGQEEQFIVCLLIRPKEKVLNERTVMKVTVSTTLPKDKVKQLLPLSLNSNLLPAKFEFEEKDEDSLKTTRVALSQPDNLLTFGVAIILNSGSALYITRSLVIILPFISLLWTNQIG